MADGEFSVWQFFENGTYERVREKVDAKEAVTAFHHYTQSIAVKLGVVERVIITDDGDHTCAEWLRGKGLTFPHKEASA